MISRIDFNIYNDLKNDLSSESTALFDKIKRASNFSIFSSHREIKTELKNIKVVELNKILKLYFWEKIIERKYSDITQVIKPLVSLISLEKLQEAVSDDIDDIALEVKSLVKEATYYFNKTEKPNFNIVSSLKAILLGISSIIDVLISTVSLGTLFKPSESEEDNMMKTQKLYMLSGFSHILSDFLKVISTSIDVIIIGKIILLAAAVGVVWQYIKPMPTFLPSSENWSAEVNKRKVVAQGRRESLNEIANILKRNRNPILVGPSRIGKTITGLAFTKAIEEGKYPELAGKKVFYIRTPEISNPPQAGFGKTPNILRNISEAMGRHRKNIILVLDEIHMACKDSKLADQLKTYFGDEDGRFPHVIGITTNDEYKTYVMENKAFSLRFDKVEIANTNEEETLKIMADKILECKSIPLLDEGTLLKIYRKSMNKNIPDIPVAQPTAALQLLERCIDLTQQTEKFPAEKKIIEVINKIESLDSTAIVEQTRNKEKALEEGKLEKELHEAQEKLKVEKIEIQKLVSAKKEIDMVTKEIYNKIRKTSKASNENRLKEFVLLQEYLRKTLKEYIRRKSEELKINIIIDEQLINSI